MSKNKYLVVILILYGFLGITTNLLCNSTLNNNRLNNNSGNDSSSVDDESKFSVKGYLSAQNKSVRDGFTVNNGISESELGAEISYFDFSITGLADKQVSANIWTYYSISLGYLHSFNDWFDLSLGVSQFKYKNDSLNPNSENTNSFKIAAIFNYSDFAYDFGFERLIGTLPVNYFSGTISYEKEFGDFQLDAFADITNPNYTKAIKEKLKTFKKLSDLKSLIYSMGLTLLYNINDGLAVSVSGMVIIDSKGKIVPVINGRVEYSFDL